MKQVPVLTSVFAVAIAMSAPVQAVKVNTDSFVNATGPCNGALPAHEGALRKRPLAIRNEGTTDAFVSCSLPGSQTDDGKTIVGAYFTNSAATTKTISCTLVDGSTVSGAPAFYAKSRDFASGETNFISWTAVEFAVTTFSRWPNLSCLLPAGTEISLVGSYYAFENGVAAP